MLTKMTCLPRRRDALALFLDLLFNLFLGRLAGGLLVCENRGEKEVDEDFIY